ncbi:hypothetical protein VNO77_17379 [Canavalia gladiata]|uniref:Uncharacterized protein n=1 Tax=Canavalia gladiata TaxID=3824 RepID=A0AAN9QIN5_CANGL
MQMPLTFWMVWKECTSEGLTFDCGAIAFQRLGISGGELVDNQLVWWLSQVIFLESDSISSLELALG